MNMRDEDTIDWIDGLTDKERDTMSEQTMRSRVVRLLAPLDGMAVENPVRPGTPDINYIPGWIECKWMRAWPKNADVAPVLMPHFTKQQRIWLKRRVRAGGEAWLMLQVRREWLIFRGDIAAKIVGYANKPELIVSAARYWENGLVEKELLSWLITPV